MDTAKTVKSDEIKTNLTKVEEVSKPKYRYFCDSCTGVAAISSEPKETKALSCKSCGVYQAARQENWILI